jgi:hypothetical protein
VTPLFFYKPQTWGPIEAGLVIADAGGWHNPDLTPPSTA